MSKEYKEYSRFKVDHRILEALKSSTNLSFTKWNKKDLIKL